MCVSCIEINVIRVRMLTGRTLPEWASPDGTSEGVVSDKIRVEEMVPRRNPVRHK